MYNSFESAIAMSYKKIKRLCLGYTYTIGFWVTKTTSYLLQLNCQL